MLNSFVRLCRMFLTPTCIKKKRFELDFLAGLRHGLSNAGKCLLISALWMWPQKLPQTSTSTPLVMKAVCWGLFDGGGRISHLWWGSVWGLIADLGSPLCRRRGISLAATRTVRSCQLFAKHGWKIVFFSFFFCRVGSRHASLQRLGGPPGELRGVRLVEGTFDQLLEEAGVSSCGRHIPGVLLQGMSLSTWIQQKPTEKTIQICCPPPAPLDYSAPFPLSGTLNFSSLHLSVLSKGGTASVQPSNGSNISEGSWQHFMVEDLQKSSKLKVWEFAS